MMIYETEVVDKENGVYKKYEIEINTLSEHRTGIEIKDESAEKKIETDPGMLLDIAKTEYENCVKRLDRLDNKIYILLTVCAFIFVMLTNAINGIREIRLPQGITESIVLLAYLVFMIYVIKRVISLLKGLIGALSSIKLLRFDTGDILDFEMISADKHKVAEYVLAIYENTRQTNNDKIDKKYDELEKSVRSLSCVVILLIILTAVGGLLPKGRETEETLPDFFPIVAEYMDKEIGDFHEKVIKELDRIDRTMMEDDTNDGK